LEETKSFRVNNPDADMRGMAHTELFDLLGHGFGNVARSNNGHGNGRF
jgi:hypothetical protein